MAVKMRDSEIEQWVLRALTSEEKLGPSEICVQAQDGVITLCGSLHDDASRMAAEHAAYRAAGVIDVVNNIQLKSCTALSPSSSAIRALALPLKPNRLPFLQRSSSSAFE